MTPREDLHSLVDALPDAELDEAARLLDELRRRPSGRVGQWPPPYVGSFESDVVVGARVDELLRDSLAS